MNEAERDHRWGRWAAIGPEYIGKRYRRYVPCQCDCGAQRDVRLDHLVSGRSPSCGCVSRQRVTKHGGHGSALYGIWRQMLARCGNPANAEFVNYGARGIRVCERWLDFAMFRADVGERPSSRHSLDRVNNSRGYEPSNVRWATMRDQNRNKRTSRMVTLRGRTQCLAAWAEEFGVPKSTLRYRLRMWPETRILAAWGEP